MIPRQTETLSLILTAQSLQAEDGVEHLVAAIDGPKLSVRREKKNIPRAMGVISCFGLAVHVRRRV